MVPGRVTNLTYNATGAVVETNDGEGHTTTVSLDSSKDYAAPSAITPYGSSALATDMRWNSFLGLTQETGPNGATLSVGYDGGARPQQTTSPYGATTTYEYNDAQRWSKATTNGRWVKTTKDGLGRTVKVETGDGTGTKSVADTQYTACACSPLGKVWRVSQPYASGGQPSAWTTYTYDRLGRTLTVA